MIFIAIFDDLQKDGKKLKMMCQKIFAQFELPANIQYYNDIDVFLKTILLHQFHSILLNIDVCMKYDTIIKQYMRMSHHRHLIVYGDGEIYINHALEYHAYAYLKLPFKQNELQNVLIDAFYYEPYLNIQNREHFYHLPIQEIHYIESNRMYVFIHLDNEMIQYRTKISHLTKFLDPYPFIRCHQSFIINLLHIRSLERYRAFMTNGIQIPISKTYSKKVRDVFQQFYQTTL